MRGPKLTSPGQNRHRMDPLSPETAVNRTEIAAFSDEDERILDADEIAAELVPDSIQPTDRARSLAHARSQMRLRPSETGSSPGMAVPLSSGPRASIPPPPPPAPVPVSVPVPAHVPVPTGSPFALTSRKSLSSTGINPAATAVAPTPNTPLSVEQLQAEVTRLRNQMRARDAYLRELERALEVTRSELAAADLRDPQDLHRLLGRVRGQSFRIAELEAELRLAKQSSATGQRNRSTTVPLRKPRHSHIGPVSPEPGTVTVNDRRTNRAW